MAFFMSFFLWKPGNAVIKYMYCLKKQLTLYKVNDIIIKNICIFVIGNGSGRFAASDEKGIR